MTTGFKIIGISTRTSNKNNQSQEDLGKRLVTSEILLDFYLKYAHQ